MLDLKIQLPTDFDKRYTEYRKKFDNEITSLSPELVVGNLIFSQPTGDFSLLKVKGNFAPDTQEFKVLLKLLTSEHYQAKSNDLLKITYPSKKEFGKPDREKLATIIKNIKIKMGILPLNKRKNKDIIQNLNTWKGYKIIG